MPLTVSSGAPTMLVRRRAFERANISRAEIDRALTLTDDEFRVEHDLVAIGPIYANDGISVLVAAFEAAGLVYYDDFVEMSGNWPEWLSVFAAARSRQG